MFEKVQEMERFNLWNHCSGMMWACGMNTAKKFEDTNGKKKVKTQRENLKSEF